jgi:hypothetical protein
VLHELGHGDSAGSLPIIALFVFSLCLHPAQKSSHCSGQSDQLCTLSAAAAAGADWPVGSPMGRVCHSNGINLSNVEMLPEA